MGIKTIERCEYIDVNAFKDIHVRFPGDVYILAIWIAKSDRVKSTPTMQQHTNLLGLASKFSSIYGDDYSNPLNSDDVMEIFRGHGINGNPCLRLEDDCKLSLNIPLTEDTPTLTKKKNCRNDETAEPVS